MKKPNSNSSKLTIQILPDDYLEPEDCLRVSNPAAKLPKDLSVILEKNIINRAVKAFNNNSQLRYMIFEAKVVSDSFKGTLSGASVVFIKYVNTISTYVRFFVKETGIRYRTEFSLGGHIDKATAKKLGLNWTYADDDDLFEGRLNTKGLRINKSHLKPNNFDKLTTMVETFNSSDAFTGDIMLFKINPTISDTAADDRGGLGVLLNDVPWSDRVKRFGYENQPERIRERLDKLKLPKEFIQLIWQAGYAGAELVIFDANGTLFEILPRYS